MFVCCYCVFLQFVLVDFCVFVNVFVVVFLNMYLLYLNFIIFLGN